MTLVSVTSVEDAKQELNRGAVGSAPVVILPVYNSYEDVVNCLNAFYRHTPADTPLLLVDDGGSDRRFVEAVDRIAGSAAHLTVVLNQPRNKGFVLTVNDGFDAAAGHDVIILNSDVVVGPEWSERLSAAANSTSTIATASALTNNGTILSVPGRNRPTSDLPAGLSVDEAARRVAAGSTLLRPRIPTAIGHCTYIKRTALDVVGTFDPIFSPGYYEEVDLSQRMLAAGYVHIAADDVFVYHRGGASFGDSPAVTKRKLTNDAVLNERYPYYLTLVHQAASDRHSALEAALLNARRAVRGLRVGVDGMALGPLPAGTQVTILETARALAAQEEVTELVLFTPAVVPEYVRVSLSGNPRITFRPVTDLKPVTVKAGQPEPDRLDVVHRPYQVRDEGEMEWLRSVADRVVVSQLDFIAYHDPAYFADTDSWLQYRDLAKLTAFTADGLTHLSEHTQADARAEGLLPEGVPTAKVYCGTEHSPSTGEGSTVPPSCAGATPGFLLVLGVAYLHKNRQFAIDLLAELRTAGWQGDLVLAGAVPTHGSTTELEKQALARHPGIAGRVFDAGMVSEAEKAWLYENAGLVVYPTISEGFGLVPFEAAALGIPCLSTRAGSLDEVLPAGIPVIDSFDPAAAAAAALPLLTDPAQAAALIEAVIERSRYYTWERSAEQVMSVLREVVRRPANRTLAVSGESGAVTLAGLTGKKLSLDKRAIRLLTRRPALRKLIPPGSRRQKVARSVFDRLPGRR
ncbi:glycosyltransferase [Nakamurella silvestris]|nr:glycosyltransferase [Nakamurella silvestris]